MGKIVVFGNGKAPCETLEFLREKKHVILVVVDPDDSGEDSWQASLLLFCKKNNISFIQPVSFSEISFLKALKEFQPDIMFSIQCRKIIKKEIIDIVHGNIFNFHFADLPKNRGCYPGIWHLLNCDTYNAVTLHRLTLGIDDGAIIDKLKMKINLHDTARSIYEWNCEQVLPLCKRNIDKLLQGTFKESRQDEGKASYYSRKSINFTNTYIDWNQDINRVARFIQAFAFPPYQYAKTRYQGKEIEIKRIVKVYAQQRKQICGRILKVNAGSVEVQVHDGSIEVQTSVRSLQKGEYFYL